MRLELWLLILINLSLLPGLWMSLTCPHYEGKFILLLDRKEGDQPCVYVSMNQNSYTQSSFRCILEIDGDYAELKTTELQPIADQLKAKGIASAFTGCAKQGENWIYYTSGMSCGGLAPEPFVNSVPHGPTSLIVAIDGTSPDAEKFIAFVDDYFTHSVLGGKTEIVAFVFGCQRGTNPRQSYSNTLDTSKLKSQLSGCGDDLGYTLSRLLSDIAYYFYSPYPVVYSTYNAQPVIILTSRSNASGVVPLTRLNSQSPVALVYSGTDTPNLSPIAIPSSAVFTIDWADDAPVEEGLDQVIFINPSQAIPFENDAADQYTLGTFLTSTTPKLYIQNISSGSQENVPRNFLCERPYASTTEEPTSGGCPTGMTLIGTKCYQLDPRNQDYQSALTECTNLQNDAKGSLAIVTTQAEMDMISSLIENEPNATGLSRFWIGLNAINCTGDCLTNGPSTDDFVWSNQADLDTDPSAMFWRHGFPRAWPGESCVAYSKNDDTWVNMVCDYELMAICWRDAKLAITTTTAPSQLGEHDLYKKK